MRKRLVLGDMHGMFGVIKDIYDLEQPDDVIIVGDYFDSFTISPELQKLAWLDLIELRKQHIKSKKGKFIMLIGNHDIHYLTNFRGQYSGYNKDTAWFASDFVSKAIDDNILSFCFVDEINKTIYTHAGVTMTWFMKWCYPSLGNINTIEYKAFEHVGSDWFGNDKRNSPIWVRPEALSNDPYIDNNGITWSQVFGHTHVNAPFHWKINDADFYGIDCICKHYLVEDLDDNHKLIKRYLGDVI